MLTHTFSDREALRIAAEIERKGERFYRMAQNLAGEGAVYNLLEMLRAQERVHAERFERMVAELEVEDEDSEIPYDYEANAFLTAIAAEIVFPGGVMASMINRKLETVRDVLLYAIGAEKDSILFYTGMLANSKSAAYTQAITEIIQEEKSHLYDLQRLLEKTE